MQENCSREMQVDFLAFLYKLPNKSKNMWTLSFFNNLPNHQTVCSTRVFHCMCCIEGKFIFFPQHHDCGHVLLLHWAQRPSKSLALPWHCRRKAELCKLQVPNKQQQQQDFSDQKITSSPASSLCELINQKSPRLCFCASDWTSAKYS